MECAVFQKYILFAEAHIILLSGCASIRYSTNADAQHLIRNIPERLNPVSPPKRVLCFYLCISVFKTANLMLFHWKQSTSVRRIYKWHTISKLPHNPRLLYLILTDVLFLDNTRNPFMLRHFRNISTFRTFKTHRHCKLSWRQWLKR